MCELIHFPFSTLKSSSSKNFFKCATLKFWKFTTVGTHFGNYCANSYILLLLNLISKQMKVYFKLIYISEYQQSAYLHLLLWLLTLKVPL